MTPTYSSEVPEIGEQGNNGHVFIHRSCHSEKANTVEK
jgi:hypothetical protein